MTLAAKKRSESRERGNEGDLYESGTLSELARLIKANVSGDWPLNLLSLPSSEERAPSFIRYGTKPVSCVRQAADGHQDNP